MRPKGNGCAVAETDVEEAFLDTQPSPLGVYRERKEETSGERQLPGRGRRAVVRWEWADRADWSEMTGGQE